MTECAYYAYQITTLMYVHFLGMLIQRSCCSSFKLQILRNIFMSIYMNFKFTELGVGWTRKDFRQLSTLDSFQNEKWQEITIDNNQSKRVKEELVKERSKWALKDQKNLGSEHELYVSGIRLCGNAGALSEGKLVHANIVRYGTKREKFVGNLLIEMYGKCGSSQNAWTAFQAIGQRNVFSWNMLVGAYVRCGSLIDARSVFDIMQELDMVSWNTMIAAYAQQGHGHDALHLFLQMHVQGISPDKVTFVTMLDIFSNLEEGRKMHLHISQSGLDSNVSVANALMKMYARCGSLEDVGRTFENMDERNVISWTLAIAAYAQHEDRKNAIYLFQRMHLQEVVPDKVTYVSILDAFLDSDCLPEARWMHAYLNAIRSELDEVVINSLIKAYGKCHSLKDAFCVFDRMPRRDVVTWSSMIAAYAHLNCGEEAFKLFEQMQCENMVPNNVTFVSTLDALASEAALAKGKHLHAQIISCGFGSDINIGNTVINLYAKSGCLESAEQNFNQMSERDIVSWNAIIGAYAQHGFGYAATAFPQQMQLEGIQPNRVTFLNALSAYCYSGLVDEANHHFVSMSCDWNLLQGLEHSTSIIDLFGRAAWLDEAEDFIHNMFELPSVRSWTAMLGACTMHSDVERGRLAAKCILELDPEDSVSYILLSNTYASAGPQLCSSTT